MVILFAGLVLAACGAKADLQKQMSGKWEDRLNHERVDLDLSGKSKTVTVSGTTYTAEVAELDQDNGRILLTVQNGSGKNETWTLKQNWEDSDRFNIIFERGDKIDVLIPSKRS
jgi:hypothetical protein